MASLLDMSLDEIVEKSRQVMITGRGKSQQRFHDRPRGQAAPRSVTILKVARADNRRNNWSGGQYVVDRTNNRNGNWRRNTLGNNRGVGGNEGNRRRNIVKVSNLDYSIMQDDLLELFSSVGEVLKVWIDYDRTDRSEGSGGCIFKWREDAERAVELYNGRLIEGLAVKMELEQPAGPQTRGAVDCPW